MKLRNLLRYFNNGIIIEIFYNSDNIYRGEIRNIPKELLDHKLDTDEDIDVTVEMDCDAILEICIK